jgi:hypothetical protein
VHDQAGISLRKQIIKEGGYLQTIGLPKETDSKSPVGVDSGKAVHVEDGDLRKGNDDRWETRSGAESKEIR